MVLSPRITWVISGLCVLFFGFGCGGESQKAKPESSPTGQQTAQEDRSRCNTDGKRVVTLDLNQNKKPDVWKIYASKVEGGTNVEILTCKEQDLNFDGRKDIWIYYDDQGNRQMEEMDTDFDGKVDLVTIRQNGKVIRQELDTNFDGKPDIWKYFENELLVRIERDSHYTGKVDYWEYYEGGQLDRIAYDKDGDGRPDEFDRAATPPALTASKQSEATSPTDKSPDSAEEMVPAEKKPPKHK